MMSELFDEQVQREQYDIAIKKAYRAEGRAEGRSEGFFEAIVGLVKDGLLSVVDAAKKANMSVSEFEEMISIKGDD